MAPLLTRLPAVRDTSLYSWRLVRRCSGVVFETKIGEDFGEETCSFMGRIRPGLPLRENPPLFRPALKNTVDFSFLQNCIIAVDKPVPSLTFDLIDRARLAMGSRHYRIGHAGVLDVMASGIVILLFGNATKHMEQIAHLEREYVGTFRLGHTTSTYDTLSPVVASRPWIHVTSGQVNHEVQRMVGQTHQLCPPEIVGKATKKGILCHLQRISRADKHQRPMELKAFEVQRDQHLVSDFAFRAICHTKLSINCLIHELGKRLECGAHVRHCQRMRLGDFSINDAWNADELMEHIAYLRRMAFLKNYDLYNQVKHGYWRPLGPFTNRKKKRIKKRWEKEKKIKKQIKEGEREPIMTALCY